MEAGPVKSCGFSGFTVIELMLGLTVLGIVLSAAIPGYMSLVRDNRLTSAVNGLVTELNFARMEALKRSVPVYVSSSGGGADYTAGWRIWADANGDGVRGAGEDLRVSMGPGGQAVIRSLDGDVFLLFDSRGGSGLDHVARVEFCPGGGGTSGRLVRVDMSGRVSVVRDHDCS